MMKAIIQHEYGSPDDVLELQDVEMPAVGDDEVLVRARAASVHPDVWHVVQGLPYALRLLGAGLRKPKIRIPGTDVAGVVEAVGKSVTRFGPGDEVFGESVRGHQWHNGGAYAEYVSVPGDALALEPANVSFEQAAAVPTSAFIALHGLCAEGQIESGQRVLVNGAGGGVGVFAVQIAKAHGADVTAVDTASKLDMLQSIGADQVIDYTRESFVEGGERYDLIFDIPGNHSLSELKRALTPGGTHVLIGHDLFGDSVGRWLGSMGRMFKRLALSPFVSYLPGMRSWKQSKTPLVVMQELLEAGKVTPVVDRTFPLSEVPEAIRYLVEGSPRGKVVITI